MTTDKDGHEITSEDVEELENKLAIAVKALEEASVSLSRTDGDYDTLCVIRSALQNVGNFEQIPNENNSFDLPDFARFENRSNITTDVDK